MDDPIARAQAMYEAQAAPGAATWAQLTPAQQQAWISKAGATSGTSAGYIAG